MSRLFSSINHVAKSIESKADFEVIIVNDSPDVEVRLPDTAKDMVNVQVYKNCDNLGIQRTRVKGFEHAAGEWILFLDQDDELLAEGFKKQLALMGISDVVVGNGLYQYENNKKKIYKSKRTMEYLIQKKRFIEIRNLIPSPGECLIRRSAIPKLWITSPLKNNGADDWYLWILLFQEGRRFSCNEELVYVHNNTSGDNLSLDLGRMYTSAMEMCESLKASMKHKEFDKIKQAIEFKYCQDTNRLKPKDIIKYRKCILDNLFYRFRLMVGC